MPFSIDKVPDAPIVILVHESNHAMSEMGDVIDALAAALDAQPVPIFLVIDIRGLTMGLDDMTSAATTATRGPGALLHHPNVRENLLISKAGLIKLGAQGLRSATFGQVNVRVFDTTEQALEYCYERITIEAGQ